MAGAVPGPEFTDRWAHYQSRFFRHHGQLQIGAIVSDSADCTRALMDFVLLSPHAAEASIVAKSTIEVSADDARKNMRLIDALEELDDVQRVTANFELSPELFAELTR